MGDASVARSKHSNAILMQVDQGLQKLSTQEQQVLRLLFGIGELPHSREELGRRLGMSRGWLRQVERRALRNLRCYAVYDDMCGAAHLPASKETS